jgi:glutamate/tyrosine decarboxylase-like PLP-dependent enzyme
MDASEFRSMGHELVDWIAGYLDGVESLPLFPDVKPEALDALFAERPPRGPLPPERVMAEVREKLIPYCAHVNHPGYLGLITPTPTPVGILGDLLASALNQNLATYSIGPSAVAMERRVVRWLCDLAGYGPGSGGFLTSGGTMANFVGLKLARDATSGDRAQHAGLSEPGAVYVSEERHISIDKAVDAVGLGRDSLRILPTDDAFRVRLDALTEALERDRRRGVRAACVIGLAGTTSTGSIDPIAALRAVADRAGAWLHVDAAYGGGMLLSRAHPGLLDEIALADSITIDPHKWFYAPLDAGAVLARDQAQLTRSFGLKPSYLTDEFDATGARYQYYVHSFEQSRRFRGLKVWMSFKRYGLDQIGGWIDANVALAGRLHARCDGHPRFRSATPPPMSAVCLRYDAPELPGTAVDRLHAAVVERVEREGRFWISTTELKGRTWFRVNPVNFRTRPEHMDALFDLLERECERARADPPEVRAG